MRAINRRRFLQLAGGNVATTMLSDSIAKALAIPANLRPDAPGHRARRRAHAGEPLLRPLLRHDARRPRLRRPAPGHAAQRQAGLAPGRRHRRSTLPFRPDADNLGMQFIQDLDHSWDGDPRGMFNGGNYDQWIPPRPRPRWRTCTRAGHPFHYALADAFTVCDAYHCSMLGPTDPNRYYMWTGWVGNDGKGGGPVIANDEIGYGWRPTPSASSRPASPGRSTRTRATAWTPPAAGAGPDDAVHRQLRRQLAALLRQLPQRPAGQPAVREGAHRHRRQHAAAASSTSCAPTSPAGKLPEVSWIVAPEAFTEHPATGRPTTAPGTSARCSTR